MMLTVYEDAEKIFSALEAGATGYLLKRTTEVELQAAIADIRQGGSPMTSAIARKVVQSFQRRSAQRGAGEAAQLSPREKEILDLLARGYLYKEIADKLQISVPTVNAPHPEHVRKAAGSFPVPGRCQVYRGMTPLAPERVAGQNPMDSPERQACSVPAELSFDDCGRSSAVRGVPGAGG